MSVSQRRRQARALSAASLSQPRDLAASASRLALAGALGSVTELAKLTTWVKLYVRPAAASNATSTMAVSALVLVVASARGRSEGQPTAAACASTMVRP